MLKRAAAVKDSGRWIKGMGGILDVLDSLLFAAPVLYIYVEWLLKRG
jgi:phosphatidate cytidylyltransferase